ncbi:MAG: helix-turn-helix domain-containing protein [Coriobacteriia bacterium]|nr:helix-turn-helix domain-containing protein [Coriobacteriia bacterium]
MDILEVLSKNLRFYRKQAGLSQEALANAAGLHRTYIGGIEQRRVNASARNLQRIASVLDIDAYQLIRPHEW